MKFLVFLFIRVLELDYRVLICSTILVETWKLILPVEKNLKKKWSRRVFEFFLWRVSICLWIGTSTGGEWTGFLDHVSWLASGGGRQQLGQALGMFWCIIWHPVLWMLINFGDLCIVRSRSRCVPAVTAWSTSLTAVTASTGRRGIGGRCGGDGAGTDRLNRQLRPPRGGHRSPGFRSAFRSSSHAPRASRRPHSHGVKRRIRISSKWAIQWTSNS